MFKVTCILVCICYLLIGSYASLAPFIDKCAWDDMPCLKSSSQKAIPYFTGGLPKFGMSPLDPMKIGKVTINEGGLHVVFEDTLMVGASKCQVLNVERNIADNTLKFSCECPIDLKGKYKASGQLLFKAAEGDGPYHIKTDKVRLDIKINLSLTDGPDGQKHWKLGDYEYEFDVQKKALLDFQNLFNGDKELAAPILTIFDQNWKQVTQTIGKHLVDDIVRQIVVSIIGFADAVPANELEL